MQQPVYFDTKFHEELDRAPIPPAIKNAIKSVNVADSVLDIGNNHDLLLGEIGELYEVTKLVLTGSLRANEFAGAIEAKLEKDHKNLAPSIAEDLNKAVLLKIREAMQNTGGSQNQPSENIVTMPKTENPPVMSSPSVNVLRNEPAKVESHIPTMPRPVAQQQTAPNIAPRFIPRNAPEAPIRKRPYGTMGSYTPTRKESQIPPPLTSFAREEIPNEPLPNRESLLKEIEDPLPQPPKEVQIPPIPQKTRPNEIPSVPPLAPNENTTAKDALLQKTTMQPAETQNKPNSYQTDPYREPTD